MRGVIDVKIRLAALLALIVCCLTGCVTEGLTREADIAALVTANEERLSKYVAAGDFSAPPDVEGVLRVEECPGDAVHFNCGAKGLGNSGTYYGFYYSYGGGPSDGWLAMDVFSEKDGGYYWKFLDNEYFTRHISGNFWYYHTRQ